MGSLCGSSGTNTVVQQSGPPPQVLQNYVNLVNQATGVAGSLAGAPGPPVAGITPQLAVGTDTINAAFGPQTQAYYGEGSSAMAAGLGTVGSGLSYLPSEISGIGAAQSMLPTAEGYVSSAAPYYGAGAGVLGESTVNPITSGGISAYMNPYTQDVVNSTEAAFNNQNAIQSNQLTGSAILGGNAFGGDRAGVAQAALAGQQQTAEAPVIAGLESSGYTSAVQEAEQQQQLEQSAAGIYGSLGAGLGSLGSITGGLAGTAGGLAGMYGTAASTAGSLGATQAGIGSELAALGPSLANTLIATGSAQEAAGATQQSTEQAQLNSEYQQYLNSIGVTGTSYLAPIVEGTGSLSGGSGTTTSPGPSTLSQIAGLGTSALALNGLSGGALTSGLSSLGTTAAGTLGSLSTGVSAAELAAMTGESVETATAALGAGLAVKHGGRIGYDDGGSVDDDQLDFGTSGSPAPQQQPGLGGIVGYDALARELSQGVAANQLAAAQGGFDGGGGVVATSSAQPLPGLASLPTGASSNSGIIGPMGMNVPRGSGPPGIHMGMGAPPPPRAAASDNDLANITKQITQVAGLMRQPGNAQTQTQATGGRVFPGIVAQGYADGGAPDQDYTAVDPGIGGVSGAAADVPNAPDVTVNGTPQAIVPVESSALPQSATPDAGPAPPGLAALQNATYGQESSYGKKTGTSSTGAVGPMQIEPATFAKYAQPGERIDNPTDNKAVGDRILADYTDKYGDPARAAVAYYSGPGNVAPADSPTPWKHDISYDRNGNPIKPVSSYVSDVLGRMGAPSGNQLSPNTAPTPGITAANPSSLDIGKPNPWESVLAAGLGMMAGQSPHALSNIGAGGLAGLQNYQEQQAELRAEATTKQGAERLAQEAAYQQGQLKNDTARTSILQQSAQQEAAVRARTAKQPIPMGTITDQFGNKIQVMGQQDPATGKLRPIDPRTGEFMQPGQNPGGGGFDSSRIDSSLVGDAYLKQFPPEIQASVKDYLAGRQMPTGNPRTGPVQMVKQIAQKYGSDIGMPADDATFAARRQMRTDLSRTTPGSLGGQLTFAGTSLSHLANVADKAADLNNVNGLGIAPLAHIINSARDLGTGQAAKVNAVNSEVQHYGQEVTKFYAGSPGGEAERTRFLSTMDSAKSSAEIAGAIRAERDLIPERVNQTAGQITQALGPEEAQKQLARVDLPGVISRINAGLARLDPTGPEAQVLKQQSAGTSAPPQTPPVAGAKLYQGKWYTRGPNGEAVPVQ